MACAGNGIKYVDTNILRYRQHENNVTNNQKFSFVSVVIGFIKNFKYKRQELHISRMNHVKSLELYLGYSKEPEKVKASVEYENENFNSECTITLDNDTDLDDSFDYFDYSFQHFA